MAAVYTDIEGVVGAGTVRYLGGPTFAVFAPLASAGSYRIDGDGTQNFKFRAERHNWCVSIIYMQTRRGFIPLEASRFE